MVNFLFSFLLYSSFRKQGNSYYSACPDFCPNGRLRCPRFHQYGYGGAGYAGNGSEGFKRAAGWRSQNQSSPGGATESRLEIAAPFSAVPPYQIRGTAVLFGHFSVPSNKRFSTQSRPRPFPRGNRIPTPSCPSPPPWAARPPPPPGVRPCLSFRLWVGLRVLFGSRGIPRVPCR